MKFHLVDNLSDIEKVVSRGLEAQQPYALDIETSGLNPWRDFIVGLSLSFNENGALYIPLRHSYGQPFDPNKALGLLEPLISQVPSLIYNIPFDGEFFHQMGTDIHPDSVDVSLLTYIHGKEPSNKLSTQAKSILNFEVWDFKDFMTRVDLPKKTSTIAEAPVGAVAEYCGRDALATYLLWKHLWPLLQNNWVYKLEAALLPITVFMRRNGVLIDREYLESEASRVAEEREHLQNLIFQQASEAVGEPITLNLASPQQVGDLLFNKIKVPIMSRSMKTKAPSTSENALAEVKWKYPIVSNVVAFRGVNKLLGSYLNKFPGLIERDGRIHTSFNQTGVVTGRYSSSDPNLQNIPNFSEWVIKGGNGGKIIANMREAFIMPPSWGWFSFDYSQIEARIAAGVTREVELLTSFRDGVDFHTKTASLVFKVPVEAVTKEQRKLGKKLNFLLLYGGEADKLYIELVKETQVTRSEAKRYRDLYYEAYPRMFREADRISKDAYMCHCVHTLFGRKVPIPDLGSVVPRIRSHGERQAYNAVIQGSAADILKIGMIKMWKMIQTNYSLSVVKPFLTVHDQTDYEVSPDVPAYEFMRDSLETLKYERDKFPVMPADVSVGSRWGSLNEKGKTESLEEFAKRLSGETKVSVRVPTQHGGGKTFILEMPSLSVMSRTQKELIDLSHFLKGKKGNNTLIARVGMEETIFLESGISIEDKDRLILMTSGKFYEKPSKKELKEL